MLLLRAAIIWLFCLWLNSHIGPVVSWYYCDDMKLEDHCNTIYKMPDGSRTKHIQCTPDQITPKEGNIFHHYPMTKYMRNLLVDWHNQYRDKIASGTEDNGKGKRYPKASRMREMIWDDELSFVSSMHTNQCAGKHSKCHNTQRFLEPGQNIGFRGGTRMYTAYDVVNVSMVNFYMEKDVVADPPTVMDEMKAEHTEGAGHFTVIINDRVSFVGCDLAWCKNCSNKYSGFRSMENGWFLLCHYESGNLFGTPVYITAPGDQETASECSDWGTGRSKRYKHLCANEGRIYPFLQAYKPPKSKGG